MEAMIANIQWEEDLNIIALVRISCPFGLLVKIEPAFTAVIAYFLDLILQVDFIKFMPQIHGLVYMLRLLKL